MTRASDLARSPLVMPLVDGGVQLASFTAVGGGAYVCPVGGTILLPAPTGSRKKIKIAIYGSGLSFLSGIVNGLTTTSFPIDGDATWEITDTDVTRGWVVAVAKTGINFSDPAEFLPSCAITTTVHNINAAATDSDSSAVAFFTEMGMRGLQDQTNWTANTNKTLLSVSSGKGVVYCVIGCTAGGAETTTFELTVDGAISTITVTGLASGERAILMPNGETNNQYTTVAQNVNPGPDALDADKATFGGIFNATYIPPWRTVSKTPLLKFNKSLLIRAKHSATITNSVATAYSAVMYRLFLAV